MTFVLSLCVSPLLAALLSFLVAQVAKVFTTWYVALRVGSVLLQQMPLSGWWVQKQLTIEQLTILSPFAAATGT